MQVKSKDIFVRRNGKSVWSGNSGFFYRMADPFGEYGVTDCERVLFTIDAIKLENEKYYNTVLKIVNQMNNDGKTSEVQRAYYCRFVKGEKSYFNPDKVFDIEDKELFKHEDYSMPCDLGVDFGGQVTSKTVFTISMMEEDGTVVRLYHKSYEVGKDDTIIADIELLMKDFNIQRVIPDECPQGDYLIRKMEEKGWDVQPMNFRSDKTKKYGAFRSKLNKGMVKTYKDDDLKTEMLAMEFSQGARQSLIMAAPGYNDDLIDSFVMSAYFYLEDDNTFNFHSWDDIE
ncbi:MAG: hypothetical protein DRP09_14685 [Candidatus Thorarchaeota archaeon]|nr:MAG: hypothetical protein DRP09_14685 [Candidatus Thorarchaeota archaeon]